MILLTLLGCGLGSQEPAVEITPEAPPAASGVVVFAGARPGVPQVLCTIRADGREQACHDDTANAFPGPANHAGDALAVVLAEDLPDAHRERLGRWSPGKAVVPLTPWAGRVRDPVWEPGDTSLLVASNAGGFSDLFRVGVDGGDPEPVVEHPAGNYEPSIHDGTIVFASSREGNAEIHRRDADGTITRLTSHPSDDMRPRWAPDGSAHAWISARSGKRRVWVAPEGGEPTSLLPPTDTDHLDYAWSPDSRYLAVVERRANGQLDIAVVEVARRVLFGTIATNDTEEHPAWSPDGSLLAFTCTRDGRSSVCVATPKGRHRRVIATLDGGDAWLPRWLR